MNTKQGDQSADLNRVLRLFEAPAESFDPFDKTNDELEERGLPPRPDPDRLPKLYKFWTQIFESRPTILGLKPDTLEKGQATVITEGPGKGQPRYVSLPLKQLTGFTTAYLRARPAGGTRQQASGNWSGASITARDGKVFTQIEAAWQTPHIEKPHGPGGAMIGPPFQMSVWIGFDGQRRYHQSSLPQIGTAHRIGIEPGIPKPSEHWAWIQWWHRSSLLEEPYTLPIAVSPGDSVRCTLTVIDGGARVQYFFKNETTNIALPLEAFQPPDNTIPLRVSGSTAEWITERPSVFPDPEQYRFPKYNTVKFTTCLARASRAGFADVERDLSSARELTMHDRRSTPARRRQLSKGRINDVQDAEEALTIYPRVIEH